MFSSNNKTNHNKDLLIFFNWLDRIFRNTFTKFIVLLTVGPLWFSLFQSKEIGRFVYLIYYCA